MHAEKRVRSRGTEGEPRRRRCPRVVLFTVTGTAKVEVLDLPEDAGPGYRMCHDGRQWLVTGSRTGSRVLIAELEAN